MEASTCSHSFIFIPIFAPPQIHASCRIRNVYFSDRLYSNEELPSDYRMEGSQSEPGLNTMVADMSSLVLGGYGDQGPRKALNKPRVDIALQTTAAGEEYSRGFHTILYSIGWSPLKFWKKAVSVCETMNSGSS